MSTHNLVHVAAILLTGLLAGLLYGYDCSVIKGLGYLSDKEYINAFKSVNKEILNPYFFISFMGSLGALLVATWLNYKEGSMTQFYFLLLATICYISGVWGITFFGNVPLNNLLEKFNTATSSVEDIQLMRQKFENNWNIFHHIRTYAAMVSFLLAIISLIKK